MPSIVSFPNFLCVLLLVALAVHILTRTPIEDTYPEITDKDLEVIYCKLPQSRRADDFWKCSSAQKLFSLLSNRCSLERRLKISSNNNETELEEEEMQEVVTVEVVEDVGVDVNEAAEEQPKEEMKSTLVDSFVISLLVCSAIASLLEWHKERSRRDEKTGEGGNGSGGRETVSDRRISLADLTVNRHIRRQDSQQAEAVRQSTTQGWRPPLVRRSSFPAQVPEQRPRLPRQQSIPATRRTSVDLDDDGSPDRRRVRIIRRH